VGQPPDHGVARDAFAAAAAAPAVGLDDTTGQDRTIWLEPLPNDLEPKLVETGERGQVRASEGSVRHVEVFQMGRVGTLIFGRPRPLCGDRRAGPRYTLNCEEPENRLFTNPGNAIPAVRALSFERLPRHPPAAPGALRGTGKYLHYYQYRVSESWQQWEPDRLLARWERVPRELPHDDTARP
jgi:hypothetical protein